MREFLNVDDLADACLFLMKSYDSPGIINVGYGKDITITELAHLISKIVSYEGQFIFDKNKLDGTPRKLLDTTKINKLGWMPKIDLEQGIKKTIEEYLTSNDLIGV